MQGVVSEGGLCGGVQGANELGAEGAREVSGALAKMPQMTSLDLVSMGGWERRVRCSEEGGGVGKWQGAWKKGDEERRRVRECG